MQQAKYFCTGDCEDISEYHHYALAFDYYTHFTSPIRRYADVIVHRVLQYSLTLQKWKQTHATQAITQNISNAPKPHPSLNKQAVAETAEHCNMRKTNAKVNYQSICRCCIALPTNFVMILKHFVIFFNRLKLFWLTFADCHDHLITIVLIIRFCLNVYSLGFAFVILLVAVAVIACVCCNVLFVLYRKLKIRVVRYIYVYYYIVIIMVLVMV